MSTTKKKTKVDNFISPVAFVGQGATSEAIQSFTQSSSQKIGYPPYEDKGIRYQKYSKTEVSPNQYQLNVQDTRFNSGAFYAILAGTYNLPRTEYPHTFYVTEIMINYDLGTFPTVITIYDGVAANPRFRIVCSNDGSRTMTLTLNTPMRFLEPNILINFDANLGALGFAHVFLRGFEE